MVVVMEALQLFVMQFVDTSWGEKLFTDFLFLKEAALGTQIYKEGDRANQIFIVSKGWVKLRKIDPGKDIDISFESRGKGELFGAACFMKPQEYTLNAVCMEDSEVMAINADDLFDLFHKDYQIGYLFLKEIAKVYFERYKSVKRQLYGMVQDPATITALPG